MTLASDFLPPDEWFDQHIPLIGQQMLTAARVMAAVGHTTTRWLVPENVCEIASLPCGRCGVHASIQLVLGQEGAEYTVLLLPTGGCTHG
jgi:hypothetical protein